MSQEDLEMGSTTTETAMLSPSDSNTSSLSTDSRQQLQSSPTHSHDSEQIQFVSVWEQPKSTPAKTKPDAAKSSPASVALIIISSFCCIIFGMVAFYFNKKAIKHYGKRDNRTGDRYARRAKIFAGVAIGVGILIVLALVAAAILLWQFQAELPLEWFHNE